jgi:nickel/cobalt exporter
VGVLASLGLPGFESKRLEVWLKVLTGVLIVLIGLWTLWTQRALFKVAQATTPAADGHSHDHPHAHDHSHDHEPGHGDHHHHDHEDAHDHHHHAHGHHGYHSHGLGVWHSHDLELATSRRPSLWILIWLGIAGGLVPDPVALSLLIRALADGSVLTGLLGVLIFSLGFALVLVAVGVIAAAVGRGLLDWLTGPRAARLQIATSLIILIVGVVLTVLALQEMNAFEQAHRTG